MTPPTYNKAIQPPPIPSQGRPPHTPTSRQHAMSLLALGDTAVLEAALKTLPSSLSYTFLRRPEVGLVMLEGRIGNTGQRFNLGEMLVTRCALRLNAHNGHPLTEGYAFIQGNNPHHALLAAFFDALMQQPEWAETLQQTLITPLVTLRQERLTALQTETAPTKVDFFTLVRGEDE